ncbi:hypothetical protein [Isoptericola sp. NPDC057191]|uniref:hypothetical protein n=1 Tax=Isoptericola sp. NPDC057191 TaxID=3346041 RepID=UPI003645CBFA
MELNDLEDPYRHVAAPTDSRSTKGTLQVVAVCFLLFIQTAITGLFLELWSWHVSNIAEAPTAFPVITRAFTAALVVGIVVTEAVMLVRRRMRSVRVAAIATGGLVFAVLLEGFGLF